ncbi:RNA polymerase recycling motor ATPase HelR [Schumannella sp. 10F1B-5-1]|uniref:RNA polymerase recycling motor ATPase HelR n=1 Tax=Schumannella sp. 10F1B-5-1 TaxID=2590780 RepID=UPI0011306FC7|nr:RNA polymerase recycling motor ATPase HelR [Schumannella sp. 10F1B-5-1]TPW77035.1 AAA family ATPase [Schumannella sp. 10F1B-5-1]
MRPHLRALRLRPPDRLAAKRDPRLIAADESHFAAIAAELARQRADLESRLATTLRLPGGSGQEALDRDQEVHRLTARLRQLSRFGLDLCLGRIVPADGSAPVYIGRLGLTDRDGERLLIDWRSPAAEPFFGATHAAPLGLASKRRYRWAHGRVSDYWDEVYRGSDLEQTAALDDQSAFIASLGGERSGRMRDVLGTIQADQDAIIRADSRGALVVDGGPGTGKTVVALHRTAYLLYADPRLSRSHGGVLFVGPSARYLDYVSDVLPSLGEDGVHIATLADLVLQGDVAVREGDPAVAALKASAALVDAVEAAVRHYERPPRDGMLVRTDWVDVELEPDDWADAFAAADRGTPHNEQRDQVWEELLTILIDKVGEEVPPHIAQRAITTNEELREAFARAWPLLDPAGVVADLLSVPAYLRACAPGLRPDDVARLQRADPRAWTTSDLPLLDAARLRIGDPDEAKRRRERETLLARETEQRETVLDDLLSSGMLDSDTDSEGLLSMLTGEYGADLREKLIDTGALPASDPDALAGPFAHILVDEAQELTDAEWAMLLRRCPSRSFTIVGDRAQARHGFAESWEQRLARVGISSATAPVELASLTINYRTPEEVMAAAEPVIHAVLPDANVPSSVRASGIPVTTIPMSERDALLDAWLDEHAEGVAVVIGDASFAPRARVASLTSELAKGLEFDLVLLAEPDEQPDSRAAAAADDASRADAARVEAAVDRYVAMTRATQQLVLLAP